LQLTKKSGVVPAPASASVRGFPTLSNSLTLMCTDVQFTFLGDLKKNILELFLTGFCIFGVMTNNKNPTSVKNKTLRIFEEQLLFLLRHCNLQSTVVAV